ncbi:hypothetical protein [Thermogemmatispora carboxidivorans]|uniref:hypothetical protein n=1 Tax=Thermogemmatispora carboxidivorans TaxID=1382306 RepID=UPI00069CA99E|nr:hypothetical protein [Thermogemmatispora carboxidivorans]
MTLWLVLVERLLLAILAGGSLIMAVCVRPPLLRVLREAGSALEVKLSDRLRLQIWGRFNGLALCCALLLLGLFVWQALLSGQGQYLLLSAGAALCALALLRKLSIDRRLHWLERQRREKGAAGEGGSAIGARERRELVLLSIGALVLSFGLLAWPLDLAAGR